MHRANFRIGTVNDYGNYGFQISAIDAALSSSTDTDLFCIRIRDRDSGDVIVYDNNAGTAEGADPARAIGAGSIIIHTDNNS